MNRPVTRLPLHVLGAGLVSSAGYCLPSSAAAIRAAVDHFEETQFVDGLGEPIIGARVQDLAAHDQSVLGGVQHWVGMLSLAMDEALAGLPAMQAERTAVLLLLPESERELDHGEIATACLGAAAGLLGGRLHAASRCFTLGSAGIGPALGAARELLSSGAAQCVLIAAVDSWLSTPCIQQALQAERLLSSDKGDGFLPGEAASAILLGAVPPAAGQSGLTIVGLGVAEEAASLASGEPNYGRGLAAALRMALGEAGLGLHQIQLCLADLAGEEYHFEEAAYAFSRVESQPAERARESLLPATRIGEVGAAFGPLLVAYAWQLARIARAPGPHTLLHLGCDSLRSAIVCRSTFAPESC